MGPAEFLKHAGEYVAKTTLAIRHSGEGRVFAFIFENALQGDFAVLEIGHQKICTFIVSSLTFIFQTIFFQFVQKIVQIFKFFKFFHTSI